ncbi:M61 family peptidase [Marinicauda algicola]|uniref:M61 family peptidase n=1 Tax=Marinicauda algicola TaxID=2029849 RepID=A0A4S2H3Z8_9PROT|nr:PDZ domain-containing protein [Marinicauda algicola]TGY90101.1 M61 family peptidase [Marinicauda algicola]
MTVRLFAIALALAPAAALAQEDAAAPVIYEVSFDNAVHNEARVSIAFSELDAGPLTVRMSRSSPGRYAIHEFARNVYDVGATGPDGEALRVVREDPYSWIIPAHEGEVRFAYTLYADRADGTYSQVDTSHAHLNMPATFAWAPGLEGRPIEVRFEPLDPNWRIATQLEPTEDPHVFRAPNLAYFMDSPTEISDFDLREWTIGEGEDAQTIRLAVHHDGTSADMDEYARRAEQVVAEQVALFGEAPEFDFGTYTFIADYLAHVDGDGMEHRNSTILSSSQGLYEAAFAQLGTLSHEFLHAWNVERLRPAELEPFDFTQANPSPALWFAEGFTSYYDGLTIHRAGIDDLDAFADDLTGLVNYVANAPGRRFYGPQAMSLRAPFVDAATAIDPDNHSNIFVSYYPYGAVIGLGLDLTLRRDFGVTLDDYMRRLWQTHGRTETPYTQADLEAALADVSGDAGFAAEFFDRHIEDGELPDLASLLAEAGLVLQPAHPGAAWLGTARFDQRGDAMILSANTLIGQPLYDAGLDRGDEIVRVGRFEIDSPQDWSQALARHAPGDTVEIVFVRLGETLAGEIAFEEDPALEVVTLESRDERPSRAQRRFRDAWLASRAE